MASEIISILAQLTIAAEEVVKILDNSFKGAGHEEEGSPIDKLRKAIARARYYANSGNKV